MALGGFPVGINKENILFSLEGIEVDLIDLGGLVARSHGLPVRKSVDYLEHKFQDAWRAPYDVKAVFLMVVLRISDYLQIQSERAAKILLKAKRFESPISKREWEKHNAVKDINILTADPERVFVIVKPETSVIYLELERLFSDIQSELDISWAILGEAYGKDPQLSKLKIKFRRIRSVIDDKDKFTKNINYVPERIFFNADPTLLKLLIGPLYGEDPQYGVRELLQNAVDAVKERSYLNNVTGSILVSLQPVKAGKHRYEIVFSDKGIGMSKETVINYFFKAGASFRKSMTWKKHFIDDDEVKIQRTGRFGVGVLAVFLLGDEFELWTKYDSVDSQGFYCKASLGMTQVELQKVECEIGTTIKIPLKESANNIINSKLKDLESKKGNRYYSSSDNLLEWFIWYFMDTPKIEFKINKDILKAFKLSKLFVSSKADTCSEGWNQFSTSEYKSIHWTFQVNEQSYYYGYDVSNKYFNELLCNGFKIKKGYAIKESSFKWIKPKISVFDNEGNLPLTLNRDYLQDDYLPFEEDLLRSICKHILSKLLKTEFLLRGNLYFAKPNYLNLCGQVNLSDFIVIHGDEFTLLNQDIFFKLNLHSIKQFWMKRSAKPEDCEIDFAGPYQTFVANKDTITFFKPILEENSNVDWFSLSKQSSRFETAFYRKYISTQKLNFLLEGNRLSKNTRSNMIREPLKKNWEQILSTKSKMGHGIRYLDLSTNVFPIIVDRSLTIKESPDFFSRHWEEMLGQEWSFPIELKKRPTIR